VFRRVVHAEPIPDIPTRLLAEVVGQRFAAVCIEVVHDKVDRVSGGVAPPFEKIEPIATRGSQRPGTGGQPARLMPQGAGLF
jgi:hypothetical protein